MNTWTNERTIEAMERAQKISDQIVMENTALYIDALSHPEKEEINYKKMRYNNQQQIALKKIVIEIGKANALYRLEQMGL